MDTNFVVNDPPNPNITRTITVYLIDLGIYPILCFFIKYLWMPTILLVSAVLKLREKLYTNPFNPVFFMLSTLKYFPGTMDMVLFHSLLLWTNHAISIQKILLALQCRLKRIFFYGFLVLTGNLTSTVIKVYIYSQNIRKKVPYEIPGNISKIMFWEYWILEYFQNAPWISHECYIHLFRSIKKYNSSFL